MTSRAGEAQHSLVCDLYRASLGQLPTRIRDNDTLLPDDGESQEFATFEDARGEAIEGARQLLSQAARSGNAGSLDQFIEVLNEAGETVLTVPVGRVLGTEAQS